MEPALERERKTTWKEFLGQHWDLIVAAEFLTSRHGRGRAAAVHRVVLPGIIDAEGGDRRYSVLCERAPG
jgi:hypothetical protein